MKKFSFLFLFAGSFFLLNHYAYCQDDTTGVSRLLQMSLSELMNQEVTTSSKFSEKLSEAPSAITVITADEIKYYNYSTLGEVLNGQCGFYLTNDKNYLYTGSRGFSRPGDYNNRIVIMVDGHIMNEIVYGSAFMGNELGLNLENVEKIELIRGPGASIYGSGAMLNTINIISKKGSDIDGAEISVAGGSFGRKEASLIYGKASGKVDFTLSGSGGISDGEDYYFPELDNPPVSDGISAGLDGEKFGNLQAKLTSGSFKVQTLFSSRWKNIPTGSFNTDLGKETYSEDDRFFLETSYKKEFSDKGGLNFRAYYDNYYYFGSYPTGGLGWWDKSEGSWAGTEGQYYGQFKNNSLTAGFELKHAIKSNYREWTASEVFFDDNFPFSFFSFYTQDQYKIAEKLSVTGGLRYDFYDKESNSFSPRIAIVYHNGSASSVKLLYSEAFRSPNMYEEYYEAEDDHKSNTGIKPEKIKALELTAQHKLTDKLYGSLSLFSFRMDRLIDLTLDETDGRTQFINAGKANGKGIEAEIRFQPGIKSGGYINYTFQRTEDESGEILTNSPSVLLKSGFNISAGKNFYISPEAYYESGRTTLAGNETDDVLLFNVTLMAANILKHFDISLKIRNITNTEYKYPGGYEHLQDAIVQDSRNIVIKLSARF